MIRRFSKRGEQQKYYRTNERIAAPTLRVLDSQSKQIGILSRSEALGKAREQRLDLVEIAPMANPPVAKIIDFKKFLYQEAKKKREEKRKSKTSETKEIRLGPFIDDHDLEVLVRRARDFLSHNDKVRLVVRFKGRQMDHPEFGRETIKKVLVALSNTARVEREPHFEGRQLISLIIPEKKKSQPKTDRTITENTNNEKKDQKISSQTV